jgi:hypothetical protein
MDNTNLINAAGKPKGNKPMVILSEAKVRGTSSTDLGTCRDYESEPNNNLSQECPAPIAIG